MGAVRSGADLRGRPEVGGGRDLCGAGFTPASGGGTAAQLWISPPSAGMNPAPQVSRRPRSWWRRRTLWGRLHAGQRRWGRCPSGDFSAVGRDKPGPTGYAAVPELAVAQERPLWGRCPSGDFSAVGRDDPAPQIPRPRRNWRWRRTLWGRLYAGQRRWDRCPNVDFTAVGRDKPGPTGFEAAPELVTAQDLVGPASRRPAEVGRLPKWGLQRRRPG